MQSILKSLLIPTLTRAFSVACAQMFPGELGRRFLCMALMGGAQLLSTLLLHALSMALPVPAPLPPPPQHVVPAPASGTLQTQSTPLFAAGPGPSSGIVSPPCQVSYTRVAGGPRAQVAQAASVPALEWHDPAATASSHVRRLHAIGRSLLSVLGAAVGAGTLLWIAFADLSPPPAPLAALLIGVALGLLQHPLAGTYLRLVLIRILVPVVH